MRTAGVHVSGMQVFIDNVVIILCSADAHHYSLFVFTIKASLFYHPDVINIPLSTYSGASLTDADALSYAG